MGPCRGPFLALAAVSLLSGCFSGSPPSHSLFFFYTSVWEPERQLLEFMAVAQVDGVTVGQYDSRTRQASPRVPWIKRVEEEDPAFWEWVTDQAQKAEKRYGWDVKNLQKQHNQSGGIYTWQSKYGCEMDGDAGWVRGYGQYSYNGEDFIFFDTETLTWTAHDVQAETMKKRWDGNVDWSQMIKAYLEGDCIEYLWKFLDYGKEVLFRKEPPTVSMSQKPSHDGLENLICRVDGFYPKEMDAVWKRDGEVWEQETFRGGIVPNSDRTFHTWLRVEVEPNDRDRYRCHVGHAALGEPLDMALKEAGSIPLGVIGRIIGGIAVITVLLLLFCKRQMLLRLVSRLFETAPLTGEGAEGQSESSSCRYLCPKSVGEEKKSALPTVKEG